ncbi:hypothetical protein AJ79_00497 [Helicocarpus griseus UAMH5409]|uniref:Circumsporozoite protein n=1 Tax=Helicocarpus griseus UAMH5409 TaxID=1447875 RepID=A0A2B7YC02_9EURO|nr:hypothetical protein AJ79_00497 [Helicocarpus griseus UAMH5409]
MLSHTVLTALLAALIEARFGQEQIPVDAIQSLQVGDAGEAQTLAGQVPGVLLGGADPCERLQLADQIVTDLGDSNDVIEAAKGLVAAEQNFNNFQADVPTLCDDPTLPATEALRGIIPLVDPDVEGSDVQNANSEASLTTPFNSDGLSVAAISEANGFANFNVAGGNAAGGNGAAGGNAANDAAAADDTASSDDAAADDATAGDTAVANCATAKKRHIRRDSAKFRFAIRGSNGASANAANNQDDSEADDSNANNNNANNNCDNFNANDTDAANDNAAAAGNNAADNAANNNAAAAANGAADFGQCDPSIAFEGGLNGRPADEFTFQAVDPLIAEGQQEALNPNIITNRVCDQLGNVCEANEAAIAACETAQAEIEALGTRDQTTADAFNQALGF